MGCDIHLYMEVWNRKTNKWKFVGMPNCHRDYPLFACLTGVVRNYINVTPLSEPKGLPGDMTKEVYADYQQCANDNHSETYYHLDDLLNTDYWDENREVMLSLDLLDYNAYKKGIIKLLILLSLIKEQIN